MLMSLLLALFVSILLTVQLLLLLLLLLYCYVAVCVIYHEVAVVVGDTDDGGHVHIAASYIAGVAVESGVWLAGCG